MLALGWMLVEQQRFRTILEKGMHFSVVIQTRAREDDFGDCDCDECASGEWGRNELN